MSIISLNDSDVSEWRTYIHHAYTCLAPRNTIKLIIKQRLVISESRLCVYSRIVVSVR